MRHFRWIGVAKSSLGKKLWSLAGSQILGSDPKASQSGPKIDPSGLTIVLTGPQDDPSSPKIDPSGPKIVPSDPPDDCLDRTDNIFSPKDGPSGPTIGISGPTIDPFSSNGRSIQCDGLVIGADNRSIQSEGRRIRSQDLPSGPRDDCLDRTDAIFSPDDDASGGKIVPSDPKIVPSGPEIVPSGPRDAEGRRVHIGARANLEAVADEVVQIVKGLDGYNRFRFTTEPDLLASWTASSNVIGPPRTGGQADGRTVTPPQPPPQAGQIQPAA